MLGNFDYVDNVAKNIIDLIEEIRWFNFDWSGFNFNWTNPSDTLIQMKNIIISNFKFNFIRLAPIKFFFSFF